MARNMRTLCLLLLSACACLGQPWTFLDPAFVCQTNQVVSTTSPDDAITNSPGYPVWGWWRADSLGSVSNLVSTWTDSWTNAFALTNPATAEKPQLWTNAVNGHNYVAFNGANKLACVPYTAGTNHEEFIVIYVPKVNTYNYRDIMGSDSSSGVIRLSSSEDGWTIYAGSYLPSVNGAPPITYTNWLIFNSVFSGTTKSRMYTNNVAVLAEGTCGNRSMSNLILGYHGYWSTVNIAEFVSYKTNLSTTARSNVWYALKTRYGL
jgi:hypothetical protein